MKIKILKFLITTVSLYGLTIATFAQDQVLDYTSYLGGSENDIMHHVGTLSDGRIVVVGGGLSEDLPVTDDAFQNVGDGDIELGDIWLGLFSADLTELEYGTYFGGSGSDQVNDLFIRNDLIYIAGSTKSTNLPTTPSAFQEEFGGGTGTDGFAAVFDASGALVLSTYFGGNNTDALHGISCDMIGNIFLCGISRSEGLATDGAYQIDLNMDEQFVDDGLVAKLSPEGDLIWSTYFGASATEGFYDMTLCNENQIALIGSTRSESGMATLDSHQPEYGGGSQDALLTSFDADGNLLWSTYFGGEEDDFFTAITSDETGRILVTGDTDSSTNIASSNGFQTEFGGGGVFVSDFFFAFFQPTGEVIWSTYFGGSGTETNGFPNNDISIVGDHFIFTGHTASETGMLYGDDPMLTEISDDDTGLISAFDLETGTPIWSTYFITNGFPSLWGHTVLDDGSIVIVGSGGDEIGSYISDDAFQLTLAGGFRDGAIFRVRDNVLSDLLTSDQDLSVNIYPNPSQGELKISSENLIEEIYVLDYSGRILLSQSSIESFGNELKLELDLPSGLYLIHGKTQKGTFFKRIVIE